MYSFQKILPIPCLCPGHRACPWPVFPPGAPAPWKCPASGRSPPGSGRRRPPCRNAAAEWSAAARSDWRAGGRWRRSAPCGPAPGAGGPQVSKRLPSCSCPRPHRHVQRADIRGKAAKAAPPSPWAYPPGRRFPPPWAPCPAPGAAPPGPPGPCASAPPYGPGRGWRPMVQQAPGHALANPFGGIGGKAKVPGVVKLPGGCQPVHQVHQGHAPAGILLGHGHHQAQIGIDHLSDGLLVPPGRSGGQAPAPPPGRRGCGEFPEVLPDIVLIPGNGDGGVFLCRLCHALIPLLSCIFR